MLESSCPVTRAIELPLVPGTPQYGRISGVPVTRLHFAWLPTGTELPHYILLECIVQQHGGCSTGGKCPPTHGIDWAFAAISTVGSSLWMRLRAATRKLAMKYHYLHSRFTNRMIRVRQPLAPLGARPRGTSLALCLTASPLRVPSTVPGPWARVRPRCFVRRQSSITWHCTWVSAGI